MTDGTAAYAGRLRDLEALAFRIRIRSALADFGELSATMGERQHAAAGSIASHATRTSGDHAVQRRLDTIEHVLFALARAQGIDPTAAG